MIRGRKSEKLYLSAFAHTLAGSTVCVSIICCWSLSCSCTMSGRSPVPSPALYFWDVASQSIWFTRLTFTSLCDELNESTRPCSAVSLARGIQCHSVISTGFDADFNAFNGHDVLVAAPATGVSTATKVAAVSASTTKTTNFFISRTSSLHGPGREPPHELLLEE